MNVQISPLCNSQRVRECQDLPLGGLGFLRCCFCLPPASLLNSCILQGDKAIILPEQRGLTRKVYTHTHTHTHTQSFRTQPTPGTPQILLFSLGHLPLIIESSCSRALSVLSCPQSSVKTQSLKMFLLTLNFRREEIVFLIAFSPRCSLNPMQNFPTPRQ